MGVTDGGLAQGLRSMAILVETECLRRGRGSGVSMVTIAPHGYHTIGSWQWQLVNSGAKVVVWVGRVPVAQDEVAETFHHGPRHAP